jgi:hypothetical protein
MNAFPADWKMNPIPAPHGREEFLGMIRDLVRASSSAV